MTFNDEKEVHTALSNLKSAGIAVDGKNLKFDISEPFSVSSSVPQRASANASVFVGNLDFTITSEMILEVCEGLMGPDAALKCRVATDRDTGELMHCMLLYFSFGYLTLFF